MFRLHAFTVAFAQIAIPSRSVPGFEIPETVTEGQTRVAGI